MGLLPHHFSNKCISPFLIPELNYDKLRGREEWGRGGEWVGRRILKFWREFALDGSITIFRRICCLLYCKLYPSYIYCAVQFP